ncbi:MAG TPA: DUF4199 domain-containing protein [Salinimicrobium sp.]|nr:DUF4199 domain-containing protein [Salinimicrobium sp.]
MKKSRIPLYYGLFIAIGLIAYFLLLSLFGVHNNPIYSVFNIVIVGVGMFAAISKYRTRKGSKFKYQKGFMAGLMTGFIATVIFTFFFGVYATELNPGFLGELITMWETEWFVDIGMVLFTVALMGFTTTLVLTFAFMQLLKDSWNTKEAQKHTFSKK